MRDIPYPTPGEVLLEEFLKPMGITQYRLAKEIGVPQRRIGEIVPASALLLWTPAFDYPNSSVCQRGFGRDCNSTTIQQMLKTISERYYPKSRRGEVKPWTQSRPNTALQRTHYVRR